jgi:hypothetical protein
VDQVLHLLSQHQLFLNSFGTSKVEYMDHSIDKDVARVDPNKIHAMKDYPLPKNIKILHGFFGLMGYYSNFVQNFGKFSTPLTTLLKMKSFIWMPKADHSFQALKDVMCKPLILALPDFTKKAS